MPVTVRGKAKVEWRPDFTLTFTSTDGLSLDPGTTLHPLLATLTNTADGSPVPDRQIKLTTNPTPRVGDGARKTTNAEGQVTFQVSNPSVESVVYTAAVIPKPPTSEPTVTTDLTITWGGVLCSTCNADIDESVPGLYPSPAQQEQLGWSVRWTVRTTSGPSCETITEVTHEQGFFYVFPDAPEWVSAAEVQNITQEASPFLTQEEIDDFIVAMTVDMDALIADLEADAC